MHRPPVRLLLLLAATSVALGGCVHRLRPRPEPALTAAPPRALQAALVIPAGWDDREDDLGRYVHLGILHRWSSQTGAGLLPALEETVGRAFAGVRRVRSADEAQDADLLLFPEVEELRAIDGWDYRFVFRMRARVVDPAGTLLLDRTYETEGKGSRRVAFWGGVFLAEEVLMGGVSEAMGRALQDFAGDLAKAQPAPPEPPAPTML